MSARKPIPTIQPLSPLGPPDPSIPKAAEMIGVSDRTLRRAIERGEIEAYNLLGELRVKLASLHLFLQRARSVPLKLLSPRWEETARQASHQNIRPARSEGSWPMRCSQGRASDPASRGRVIPEGRPRNDCGPTGTSGEAD